MTETIRFRPRTITQLCVWLLLFCGTSLAATSWMFVSGPPLAELHCSRTTHECRELSSDGMGLTKQRISFGFKFLKDSRLETSRYGTEWVVTDGDHDRQFGGASEDAAQIAEYRRLAADFEDFLTNPSRDRFDAVYNAIGISIPFMPIFMAVFGLGLLVLAFTWWRGWIADLHFDRAAGNVTIDRRPMFFTGARHATLQLARLVPVFVEEDRAQTFMGKYGPIKTTKFMRMELRDRDGACYFSYAVPYEGEARPAVDERIAKIRSYFP